MAWKAKGQNIPKNLDDFNYKGMASPSRDAQIRRKNLPRANFSKYFGHTMH